jgi:hypothetical protein
MYPYENSLPTHATYLCKSNEHEDPFKLLAVPVIVIHDSDTKTEGEMTKTPMEEELTVTEWMMVPK